MSAPVHLTADERTVLDERARMLARPMDAAEVSGTDHLVVRVGPQRLAIPADRTRHVSEPRPITPAPAASAAVVGVAVVLGHVVAVADLAALLQIDPAVPPSQCHLVLLDESLGSLALLVDAVERLSPVDAGRTPADEARGELTSDAGEVRVLHIDALLATIPMSDPRNRTGETT